ncbi:MAG: carbohydrate ABC transporter permease [Oscillospiraceae bacterium]|nr:carbohydrate ABC transporter permease [Oscillospiraceae bacterium]
MAKTKGTRIKKDATTLTFDIIKIFLLSIVALLCTLPFLIILSGSFSNNSIVMKEGFGLLPKGFNTDSYDRLFRTPKDILQAYKMTIYYTLVGTSLGLLMITLTSYVLSRPEFKYRNNVSFLIYFTTIFGGGMVPWYLMYTSVLGLKGSTFAIWFPALMSPFLIIIMRTFIKESVPDAITESAKIDGAGHLTIFTRIVLPVIGPGLATVGLFLALGYWNDWYRSSMFSRSNETWSLQFYLYNMINSTQAALMLAQSANISLSDLPTVTLRMAMAIVATGPVLLVYPFVQRYFISGITIGAVKG